MVVKDQLKFHNLEGKMSGFKITFPGNKKVDVSFDNFKIKTDQAEESGGEGSAPEPFDVFVGAIGACAGIYAKSFCDVRQLNTENMYLSVDVDKQDDQKLISRLDLTLYVDQAFPEKYIKAVIKAMDSCAVKNQLHPDIATNTSVIYLDH